MSNSISNNIKVYYNNDEYSAFIKYKGHPISAIGNTEYLVYKSISDLMTFVDFVEEKKIKKLTNKNQA